MSPLALGRRGRSGRLDRTGDDHFWAVDTVGLDAEEIRAYVRYREQKEREIEQRPLDF